MIKQIAPNGLKITYNYDDLTRLNKVFDHTGKLTKAYDYLLGDGVNRVIEYTPRIEGTTIGANASDKITKIQYLDNRGKPSQTVHYLAAPDATNSIVTDAVQHDDFQRVKRSYVPFSANVNNSTPATLPTTVNGDSRPYAENITYDTSPLNRLYEVRGVGDAWAAKKSSVHEEATGGLRKYTVASNGATAKSVADESLTYGSNTLIKKTTTDEQGNKIITYTDKDGQVLQKEQELNATETAKTAYIFNDVGQLCYVVQPMGFDNAEKFIESDAVFTNFIFAYKYDTQGRQTASHVPGGGWTNFVYDTKDRKVLEQNALQASLGRWTYYKYDVFDRLIETGETVNSGSQSSLQTDFNGVSAGVYPGSVAVLTTEQKLINTYDSQLTNSFVEAGKFHDHYNNYKGLLASTSVRNIDNIGFDVNRNYIDNRGRVIQSQTTHHLSTSPNIMQMGYDFANNKTNHIIIRKKTGEDDITENLVSTFDHMNRVTNITHQLNSQPVTTLAEFTYNSLGQLSNKKINPGIVSKVCGGSAQSTTSDLWTKPSTWSSGVVPSAGELVKIMPGHTVNLLSNETGYAGTVENMGTVNFAQNSTIMLDGNTSSSPSTTQLAALQTVDYTYHIRNWLTGINPSLSASEGDIFSYKLEYETAGFFDGNIGKATWQSPENLGSCSMPTRTITNSFDKASRLLAATYTSTKPNENFSLSGITLDLNGNIKSLKRQGNTSIGSTASFGLIDDLSYDYTASGNRLNYVNDVVTGNANVGDFRNTNTGTDDYTYWPDGSLKTDKNKGITLIEYDSFNKKINRVEFGTTKWINFKYDGAGTLLQKSNSLPETWNFADGMVYKKMGSNPDVAYQIPTPEGRIANNAGTWAYEYEYRDIMGNLRASYKNDNGVLKIVQLSDYDALGFEHYRNSIFTGNTPQQYRYQNQLRIDDFDIGWDFLKFRALDYQIGRFFSVDPSPDVMGQESLTSYQFGLNNPLRYPDPNGDCPRCLKALLKTAVKSVIKGKVDLGEVYDVIDAGRTIIDPTSSLLDKGIAVFDIVSPVSSKELKAGAKFLESVGDVKKAAKGGVYTLTDEAGDIVRSGRTKDLNKRKAQHQSSEETKDLKFKEEHRTDDYNEQRGLEQDVYDNNPKAKSSNGGLNKIKPIRDNNPNKPIYEKAAEDFLKQNK